MGLTLAQLDRLLADWQQKAAAANQNLLDLHDLPAYQRLSGMGNPPSNVIGITQQQASTALTAIDRLFEYLELLNQSIDRSRKLRRELPSLFVSDSKLQEIEQLLTGMSVELPSIQKPIAERDLLSSSQQFRAVSLETLLDRMTVAFTIARDTFVAVDTAWIELESNLISTHQSLIELKQLATKLQIGAPESLKIAETNFTNLQLQIDRDPLGVNRTFDRDIIPLIDRSRSELVTLDRQRQQLQSDLTTAAQELQHLQHLHRELIAVSAESHAKISHSLPTISPLPPEELTELERWLERLVTKFASGIIPPVRVGLTNWLNKVRAYTLAVQSALAANRLQIDTRQELRGRLDALTAKALAKGKAEDPLLTDLATRASQVLYTSPTDLNLGKDLVTRYEQALNRDLTR
ncbi:hypothetical protein [Chamaesiphon sp. VAR_48_metabat_135_sub]|uniref:hypothetical protein n=1 Tax=Chamaesiphon sp. VAR_48_metabat_135_sub TaxID=2964699 RepID=UPI00286A4982|nr:hypothetical protein [Chamaesiphon sp. VAR_48_metabat_135_sub]